MNEFEVLNPLLHIRYLNEPFDSEVLSAVNSIFTASGIIYSQINLYPELLKSFKEKNWVIWVENPNYHPKIAISTIETIKRFVDLAEPSYLVFITPPSPMTYYMLKSSFRYPIFPLIISCPYIHTVTPRRLDEREPIWIPYIYPPSYNENAILNLLEEAEIPIEVARWQYSVLGMTFRLGEAYGIPYFRFSDSVSRHWWMGVKMGCVVINYRTRSEFYWTVTFNGQDSSFYDHFVVVDQLDEFVNAVKRAHNDPDWRYQLIELANKWLQKEIVIKHFDYHILWERWHDEHGSYIPLGKDLTPFHYYPENYWTEDMLTNEFFPKGAWSLRPAPYTIKRNTQQ